MSWPNVALADVLTPAAQRIDLDPDVIYSQVTARLWGKGLAHRGTLKGSEIAASQQVRVRAGQFLISKIDARHGAFGIVPPELDGAVVSNDFPAFDVVEAQALPKYVAWVARTDWFVDLCRRASEGSTNRVRLKEGRFLAQEIPLPPLDEQRRIVKRLDSAAAAVERIQRLRTAISADLASLVVRANDTYQARSYSLEEALLLREKRVPLDPDATYPQVGIKGFGGGLFKKGGVTAAETTYRHLNQLEAGQFVVSQVKGWEGAVAVCDEKYAGLFASPEYRTFDCHSDVLRPTYLAFLCRTAWFHALLAPATRGQGARRERLRPEMLLRLSLPLPSVETQAILELAFSRADAAVANSNTAPLDHLLPAMLHEVLGR